MDERFAQIDNRFARVDDRFDAMQRVIVQCFVALAAAMVTGFVAVITLIAAHY
jgi:hypothetical protein